MSGLNRLLSIALTAVGDACRVARSVQSRLETTCKILKSDKSPVTVADFAVQSIVAQRLVKSLPGTLLVGEESSGILRSEAEMRAAVVHAVREVWPEAGESDVLSAIDLGNHDATASAYWTVDPIDGTKGFLRLGQYAVSLAYIEAGEVVVGVMGCPNLSADFDRPFDQPDPNGLLFSAIAGGGCFVRPASAAHAPTQRVEASAYHGAIRVCESVESGHSNQEDSERVIAALGGAGTPARLDSQCKYGVVARGQADAYLRLPTRGDYVENIWDHAAGMLIAVEAGAIVTDIDNKPLDFSQGMGLAANRGIVCASPRFHEKIVAEIRALGI
ncbi:MAG: 3'(2'),5'-bisphosphate nucleotidase [Gammaproteobacteria bacterium]